MHTIKTCIVCGEQMEPEILIEHIESEHPEAVQEVKIGPARWPDGELVIWDGNFGPEDFTGPTRVDRLAEQERLTRLWRRIFSAASLGGAASVGFFIGWVASR